MDPGILLAPPRTSRWSDIVHAETPLVAEPRELGMLESTAKHLLVSAPFELHGNGNPEGAVARLGPLPADLAQDVLHLARRFAALVRCEEIGIRLEGVTTNACRKIHADYTDIRLITTYAGQGTQVLPAESEPEVRNLWQVPAGWIGLFKGRLFKTGHPPCFHRSPPVGDSGEKRLVLVIDTPAFANENLMQGHVK